MLTKYMYEYMIAMQGEFDSEICQLSEQMVDI